MDNVVYNSLNRYYHTLEVKGYMADIQIYKLLILCFYKDYLMQNSCSISEKDYNKIKQALYCLFGTTCLIPYPDYLKMKKLYLGKLSELSRRIQVLEETPVLKVMEDPGDTTHESDVIVMQED